MKNTKGMTLIEVIISLLIISTASLIIVVGFVTALNLFTDSNHYKDVTNKQQKALVDEENKDTDIDVDDTLANYSITVNESGNPIIINGTYKKATSKTYKDVNLSNFIPSIQISETVKGRNIYKNYCKMMQEFSNYLKEQGVTSDDKLFEGKTKEYIKEWMMQKTGENKSDFITNLPKLYASIYPDIELDSLLEVIGTYNKDFDKEKYGYRLCITDTKGSHADLTDEYAAVPKEMKLVAKYFGKKVLRDVSANDVLENIHNLREKLGDRCVLRAIHFICENERVQKEVRALKSGNIGAFLENVKASGNSSFKYLQNVYSNQDIKNQNVSVALIVSEMLLGENGVCRVHGGGFAGTIQAFVKNEYVESYKSGMDNVFGNGSCKDLRIRKYGGIKVL
mgnify:CR=1 FL=1